MNRLAETTLADGRVSTNSYDKLGRLIARTGAGAVPVAYEYNAAGQMTKLIDGEGNETEFYWDCCGLTEKVYADGSSYSYAYDERGWLELRTDAKSNTTAYAYNKEGQLTNIDYIADTDISFQYDNLARMTSRVDAAGSSSWTYDGESPRVLTESWIHDSMTSVVTRTYHTGSYELASVSLDPTNKTEYSWYQGRLTGVVALAFSPLQELRSGAWALAK